MDAEAHLYVNHGMQIARLEAKVSELEGRMAYINGFIHEILTYKTALQKAITEKERNQS